MEKIKFNLKSSIRHIISNPVYIVFLILVVVLWGVLSAATIPNPPSGLTYGTIISNNVPLVWTDNSDNEDKFNIERKLSTDATYSQLFQSGANVTSYTDPSVPPGIYDYRVQACLSGTGCSTYSEITGVLVSSSVSIPISPSGLTYGTVVSNSVPLIWTDNSDNEDKFNIERKLSTDATYSPLILLSGSNITSYTDPSVPPGIYDYRVQACLSSVGCSSYSEVTSVLVSSAAIIIPVAPSGFTLNASQPTTAISLVWTDNSDNETYFNIKRKLNTDTTWPSSFLVQPPANTIIYDDTSAAVSVYYDYSIQACLSSSCSSWVELIGVTKNSGTLNIPTAPSGLTYGTVFINKVPLIWTDNSDNETHFNIERKKSTITTWSFLTSIATANITSYNDSTVSAGWVYDYRIQACRSGYGCSAYSEVTDVVVPSSTTNSGGGSVTTNTTTNFIPNAPSGLTYGAVAYNSIKLNWVDNATNEDKFNIERRLNGMLTWSFVSQLTGSNITSYTDSSVLGGNTYDYRVQACLSGTGCSSYSIVSGIFVPANITNTIPIITNTIPITTVPTTTTTITPTTTPFITSPTSDTSTTTNPTTIINKDLIPPTQETINNKSINEIINIISGGGDNKIEILGEEIINLLYKDTNKDGVSDYDSIYIYNLDPIKVSPKSKYEGRDINASEKILLGFDPTQEELIKVEIEEPIESKAGIISSYKVNEIILGEEKKVVFKGQALPNSFISVYIYSTPIMVTVKTDNNGEWQYVLDKELENGEHTVYTATVNNTGNIVAVSTGYIFTKTAEAITLKDAPLTEAVVGVKKPGLLEGNNLYFAIGLLFVIIIGVLILTGILSRKNTQSQN